MLNDRELRRRERVLKSMIEIYCRAHHGTREQLCPSCERLYEYAQQRMASCSILDARFFCSSCDVHCYGPDERQQIRTIMRYSGRRMVLYHPLMAVSHLAGRLRRHKRS